MALKLSLVTRFRMADNSSDAIPASVAIKPSMVAISGAIIPEPLAIPEITQFLPLMVKLAVAPFSKVSVVRMAKAASCQLAGADAASAAKCVVISSAFKGSPITPVEAVAIISAGISSVFDKAETHASTDSMPFAPVKALALPALTKIARIDPLSATAREASTGADAVADLVNTPAKLVPSSKHIKSKSSRF